MIFVCFRHSLKNGFEFQSLFFGFRLTLKKRFEIRFSYFVFRLTLKNGIDFRFSFSDYFKTYGIPSCLGLGKSCSVTLRQLEIWGIF